MSPDARLDEDRLFLERSLADLDAEHAAGDLAERDWQRLRASYSARLAALDDAPAPEVPAPAPRPGRRRWWLLAAAGVLLAAVVAGLIVRSTGNRLPSGVATGSAVGPERVAALLSAAATASANGDQVKAIEDYEAVLKTDANQVVALTGEGWILAQTQQPSLLQQGIGLLSRAITAQPAYPPAHVYRGVAYLSEDDYGDAVTDLQWYLAHDPDPSLVPRVQSALATAQAGVARAAGQGGAAPAGGQGG